MARKRKVHIEKFPGIPRGTEHLKDRLEETDPETGEVKRKRHPRLDALGREISDPLPLTMPLKKGSNIFTAEQLQRARALYEESGGNLEPESIEEANDFDVDDDFGDFVSVWEQSADDLRAIEEYKQWKATGDIPEHMLRTLELQRQRETRKRSWAAGPSRPPEKPVEGTASSGTPPAANSGNAS